MADATDQYDYDYDYEDEPDDEEWQEGDCDNCYGDTGETVTNRPDGWTSCACASGTGADAENCHCGPPTSDES